MSISLHKTDGDFVTHQKKKQKNNTFDFGLDP